MITRRNFLRNAAGLLVAAPFVVKASSLMPVKTLTAPPYVLLSPYTWGSGLSLIGDYDECCPTSYRSVMYLPWTYERSLQAQSRLQRA